MADNSSFQYTRLDLDRVDFRLLLVWPGKREDAITCGLTPASLKNGSPLAYETISYCWGDARDRVTIRLNGFPLPVPNSAAAAIRRVRFPDQDRTIWIDSVCTNQNDLVERAQQVPLMGDVYSKSRGNLVYLGEGDMSTKIAIEAVNTVTDHIMRQTLNLQSIVGTPLDPMASLP